jgi:hypothetical protein
LLFNPVSEIRRVSPSSFVKSNTDIFAIQLLFFPTAGINHKISVKNQERLASLYPICIYEGRGQKSGQYSGVAIYCPVAGFVAIKSLIKLISNQQPIRYSLKLVEILF